MISVFSDAGVRAMPEAEFAERLDRLEGASLRPFSATSQEVLFRLSKQLVSKRETPQFAALGYWLRPASIKRLKDVFLGSLPATHHPVARGMAFHLPPSNVDTLFVYSWALSLLAGNANIVRLPSRRSPRVDWLIRALIEILKGAGDDDRHVFCSYEVGTGLNREISLRSDLRIIWGGDAKVNEVSLDRVRPDGLSIGFPDRKSLAVLDGTEYARLEPPARGALAEKLFNDVFWFDQMACGSPRVIAWIGDPLPSAELSADLYQRLVAIAVRKAYVVESSVAIAKFGYLNDMLASGKGRSAIRMGNQLSVLELDASDVRPPSYVMGGGLIGHVVLPEIEAVAALVDRATQTITHFGFDRIRLESLVARLANKGGFRVVPVGQALAFDYTWDGVPLMEHMTRRIVLTVS
jgi:hypothetical protein